MSTLSAEEYRLRYGATTGDRVRLGDTDLWVRVEEDRTARGDEPVWGYAKNLRSRMAQWDRAAGPSELDVVLTGALVIDPVIGVVKADIGIKDGRIAGIGRSGSPAISDGIDLVIGPHTKSYMAYGLIATPGGVDSHVHTITPELLAPALSGGVTTFVTAGFEEPPFAMERVLAGMEAWPINIGMQAGARATDERHLDDAGRRRRGGLQDPRGQRRVPGPHRLRPALRRRARPLGALHTDGLHESAELEDTVAAIAGRTVHAYHVEGTGRRPRARPAGPRPRADRSSARRRRRRSRSASTPPPSTSPMTVLNHGLSWAIPEDVALVLERVLEARMAAEGPLHELGAISIVNSDSQGMGRIGETLRRTFQLAHVMKAWRRSGAADGVAGLPDDPGLADPDDRDDTARVLRYLAKATIEPAITHGIADHVGSLQPGRLADIVLWKPGVLRGQARVGVQGRVPGLGAAGRGQRVGRACRADALSAPTGRACRPPRRRGLGDVRLGWALPRRGRGVPSGRGHGARSSPAAGMRGLTRSSLLRNRATPPVDIDVRTGAVSLGGVRLAVDPVARCR